MTRTLYVLSLPEQIGLMPSRDKAWRDEVRQRYAEKTRPTASPNITPQPTAIEDGISLASAIEAASLSAAKDTAESAAVGSATETPKEQHQHSQHTRPRPSMKRTLLFLALLLAFSTAEAQKKAVIDLKADYGLSEVQSKLQLSNLGAISVTSAKFPRAYARCTGKGWSDAKFQTLSCFDAAWMDAVYQGQGGGQPITGTLNSQNHVIVPAGAYYQTVIAEFSGGEYIGQGSGYTDAGNASVNTALVLWHELWNGDPAERHCLQSGTWGVTGSSAGYQESTIIRGFSLEGRSKEFKDLKFNSSGIRNWKPGECSYTTDVYARDFRTYGITMYAPTPHDIGVVSVFDNVKGGIGCVGCWGGSIHVGEVSGDDNGAMIESVPYFGPVDTTQGGGTWDVDLVKLETCVATGGNPPTRVYRGQAVAVMEGQFAMNIGGISAASSFCDVDALFITNHKLTNGAVQSSHINVGSMKGFNFSTLLHDRGNLKRWAYPGDYVALGFEWTSRGGGILTTVPAITSSPACSQRIDFLRTSGTPSHTTCTPYRYILDGPPRAATTTYLDAAVTPPPSTGTWTCAPWSQWTACSGGSQMRTRVCTCSGTCTDPKPVETETQACTTTPPPTGGVIATKGSNLDPNANELVNWKAVKRIKFYDVKFLDAPNYQRLAHATATDANGLRVTTSGTWKMPNGATAVAPAYVANQVFATYEIVLPVATDLAYWLGRSSSGAALRFECSKVEILP